MGSEEPDSRAASPQLDDIKGERWALKRCGESVSNAVSVKFVLLSLAKKNCGCLGYVYSLTSLPSFSTDFLELLFC